MSVPISLPLASTAASSAGGVQDIALAPLIMGLLGGLALFLYGMDKMATALKAATGSRMKKILRKLTRNRFMGIFTGAFVTAVVQSSSVTTVLVVGFVSAGLMTFAQSIGVIMGANIGTTVTAQIIAFRVTKVALLIIAAGFALTLSSSTRSLRQHGAAIMGLGLVFFGMAIMGDAMLPLRSFPPFLQLMAQMEVPALGILVGAAFTALVQSSSATTGIVIVLASQGLLTLPAGIALALGANVGTCVTALLAAFGRPREAVRASLVHVLFNLVGVLIWLPFIDLLAHGATVFSPQYPELLGAARRAAETPRQVANAHTFFNVANTVLMIGLVPQISRWVERWVPDLSPEEAKEVRARFLDTSLLDTPALALDRVRLEIVHLGEHVQKMLRAILPAVLDGSRRDLEEVAQLDEVVDRLHGKVITYLGRLSQAELSDRETREMMQLMEATNSLENIGDIVETNLVNLGFERIDLEVKVSEPTREVLRDFHETVEEALELALRATLEGDVEAARRVVAMKGEVQRMAEDAAHHGARRLVVEEPRRLAAYTTETDILQNLRRIYYFIKRIVRALVPEAG